MKFLDKSKIFKAIIIFLIMILLGITSYIILKNNLKVKNESLTIDTKTKNSYIIQEELNHNNISEEILDSSKCNYEINDNAEVVINNYISDKDCVIVQDKINGYEINKINEKAFANNENLEMIKVPEKVASNIEKIEDFEVNDILTNNEYTIYTTTKEYNEDYIKYNQLSDEEKNTYEVIPEKFLTPITTIYSDKLYTNLSDNYIPSSYDLRDHISVQVEDQGPLGICYAYATLTSVETNISLTHKKLVDFSDIHLAVVSRQGCAGNFTSSYFFYLLPGFGPVNESFLKKEEIIKKKNYRDEIIYNYCSQENFNNTSELDKIIQNITTTPQYYVLSFKGFASFSRR